MTSVDARGKSCPLPIVLTAKAIRAVPIGERLVVQSDDRAFVPDVEAWCKKTGHELVSVESKAGYYEATVRKTH